MQTGKIAEELDYVHHNVRTQLDEIKRRELERLRELSMKHYRLTNEIDTEHMKVAEHVDHRNHATFEIEDLKRLIDRTSKDLAKADEQRREEFKNYELQKEFEKQEQLKELDEEHRKKFEEDLRKQQEKHNKHEKVHYPGNKEQLEEVWEKQDHMEGLDFDPKTFFQLHGEHYLYMSIMSMKENRCQQIYLFNSSLYKRRDFYKLRHFFFKIVSL